MRRRSKVSSKMAKGRSRKAKAPNAVRHSSSSASGQETEVARLTRERDEAMEWHDAIGEILSSISGSMTDPGPVFDAIVRNLIRLFGTGFAVVTLIRGDKLELVGIRGEPGFEKLAAHYPVPLNNRTLAGKVIAAGKPIQLAPIIDNPESPPSTEQWARQFNYNSQISVPLIRNGVAIGAISTSRRNAEPFTDRQVELVQNFAAQAVIAIENARLLNELRQSLEQQTATSEILSSMSGSMMDTKPVFDAIVCNLLRLFGTGYATVQLLKEGMIHLAALDGEPGFEGLAANFPRPLDDSTAIGHAMLLKQVVQFAPVIGNPTAPPASERFAREYAYNSMISAPMMRGDEVIGGIVTARRDPAAFDDKQIALIKSFAAQAVIAIENARLVNELRQRTSDLSESLEQQTATSEVLAVISKSPADLKPVFEAMLENAVRICDAKFGSLFRFDGKAFHLAAEVGTPPELAEAQRQSLRTGPTPGGLLDRAMRTKQIIHSADAAKDAAVGVAAKFGGARSTICVPMLKDDELIGAILIYRQEVRPFTDKQIELVKNFAAQAVIAIENTRLLNELRQRTDDL